jgi:hypothetical protein
MDGCLRLFCVFAVGNGFATGWSPVQEVGPTVYMVKELKWNKAIYGCPILQSGTTGKRETDGYKIINLITQDTIHLLFLMYKSESFIPLLFVACVAICVALVM